MQLLKKFHQFFLENEGVGDDLLGLTLEKSQSLHLKYRKKGAEVEYFANYFCSIDTNNTISVI